MRTDTTNTETLASLCALMSFPTNSASVSDWLITAPRANTLTSLLLGGLELDHLTLDGVPALGLRDESSNALAAALEAEGHKIRSFKIDAQCISTTSVRLLTPALGPGTEQIELTGFHIWDGIANPLGLAINSCGSLSRLKVSLEANDSQTAADFLSWIAKTNWLTSIELIFPGRQPRDQELAKLITAFPQFPKLRCLTLQSRSGGEKTAAALAALRVLWMEELVVAANLGDKGISAMVDHALASKSSEEGACCRLRKLDLSYNRAHSVGYGKVAQLVTLCPQLRVLAMSANNIGENAAAALGKAIRGSCARTLEVLELSGCEFYGEATKLLFDAMGAGYAMTSLDFGYNCTGNLGVMSIVRFLQGSTRGDLTFLDLTCNNFGPDSALELSKVLARASFLRTLRCHSQDIGPKGSAAILHSLALPGRAPMLEIVMSSCEMKDEGALAAEKAIRATGMKKINFQGNGIGAVGATAIFCAVGDTTWTEALTMNENPFGTAGAICAAEKIIRPNKSVVSLCICSTDIGLEGVKAVASAFRGRKKGALRALKVIAGGPDDAGRKIIDEEQKRETEVRKEAVLS